MDKRERNIKENRRRDDVTSDVIADSLRAKGKNHKRNETAKTNRLWLWLGVLVLVLILIWFLFTYVIGVDLVGGFNG